MNEPICLEATVFWRPAEGEAVLRAVRLPPGATLADAVRASGVAEVLPDAGWEQGDGALRLAVFGVCKRGQDALHAGDRVDITRPLTVDPKEARRARARKAAKGGLELLDK